MQLSHTSSQTVYMNKVKYVRIINVWGCAKILPTEEIDLKNHRYLSTMQVLLFLQDFVSKLDGLFIVHAIQSI